MTPIEALLAKSKVNGGDKFDSLLSNPLRAACVLSREMVTHQSAKIPEVAKGSAPQWFIDEIISFKEMCRREFLSDSSAKDEIIRIAVEVLDKLRRNDGVLGDLYSAQITREALERINEIAAGVMK